MKRTFSLVLLTAALISAQPSGDVQKNIVDIQPLALMNGISGSYTRLVGKSVGIQAEGGVILWDPFGMESEGARGAILVPIYLRTKKKHWGMSSPYISPFIQYQKGESDLKGSRSINGSDITRYSVEAVKVGASFGRKWIFDSGFNLGIRAGYGFFPMYNDDRGDNPLVLTDDEWSTAEKFGKFISGFDAAFQVGFAF